MLDVKKNKGSYLIKNKIVMKKAEELCPTFSSKGLNAKQMLIKRFMKKSNRSCHLLQENLPRIYHSRNLIHVSVLNVTWLLLVEDNWTVLSNKSSSIRIKLWVLLYLKTRVNPSSWRRTVRKMILLSGIMANLSLLQLVSMWWSSVETSTLMETSWATLQNMSIILAIQIVSCILY